MTTAPTARILVIDDNAGVVDILAAHLRREGYQVSGALTGEEGMKDLILTPPGSRSARHYTPGRDEWDRAPQANPLDQSDRPGSRGDREYRLGHSPGGV
jgi:hypothetical protein